MKGLLALLSLAVVILIAGCNLSVGVVDNPPQATNTQINPVVERPTTQAQPATKTPQVSPTSIAIQPTNTTACITRTDWPAYQVAVGDTIGQIASRTGTSAAALTQANCLTNANLISVGQTLRIPRQPLPPTVVPPTVEPTKVTQQLGSINISKYLWADAGNYVLPGGESIKLTWEGGPADAIRTDFFTRASNGAMILISTDTNPSDGLSTIWLAPINLTAELTASAIRPDGSSVTPIFRPSVSVLDPNAPNNALTLNTYLSFTNEIYTIKPGQAEVVLWNTAPQAATHVDFVFSPADHSAARPLGSVTNLLNGAAISATFNAGDFGVISAEAFLKDGTHLYFAKPISISAPAPAEAIPEATAAQ
jgi:LysM repeat protein